MLTQLRAVGLTFTADNDRLLVEPRARLTDKLRAVIRAHKPDLLRELTAEQRRMAILAARDTAGLEHFRDGLVMDRLHLCGNCTRFTLGKIGPGGLGWCDRYETDAYPFVPMLRCAAFSARANAPAPACLPDPVGRRARQL